MKNTVLYSCLWFLVASPLGAVAAEPIFVDFDSATFTNPTNIDNRWLPLKPGSGIVLEGTTSEEGEVLTRRIDFMVTGLTKKIDGVDAVVAYIDDFADDQLVEAEIAFYAQDDDGNIWYLGEYPEEYEDGEFIGAKPWIHGLDEAKAGMKMKASPKVGEDPYFQGWGPSVGWNDFAFVSETGINDCVETGCFEDVLIIKETSLGEEGAFQLKYYAPDIGNLRVGWEGNDASREELEMVERVTLDAEELEELNEKARALDKRGSEINEIYGKTSPVN